jgi:hypothetical protein
MVTAVGTVIAGSTAAVNAPALSTITKVDSADFTIPADGLYVLAIANSGTLVATSVVSIAAILQTRTV